MELREKEGGMEHSLDLPLREVLKIIQDRIALRSTYFGIETQKSPLDFWVYQELICKQRPEVILEIGTRFGGSTLAFAHLLDNLGGGEIIGLDVSQKMIPDLVRRHPRVTLIEGDACESYQQVEQLIARRKNIFVIEDSSHTYDNTLAVLRKYSGFVPRDGWLIVEDGICHHGLEVGPQPGPYEAIEAFTVENPAFVVDREQEDFLVTWNPKGYLRRIA